jgi:hypothetical protein
MQDHRCPVGIEHGGERKVRIEHLLESVRLAYNIHETIHAAWRNPPQTEALDDDFTLRLPPSTVKVMGDRVFV